MSVIVREKMAVFSIVAFSNAPALGQAIKEQYGAGHFEFTSSTWFVQDNGSTKTVADKIGLTNGAIGAQGAVLRFDGYSGYGPVAAWDWLRTTAAISNG